MMSCRSLDDLLSSPDVIFTIRVWELDTATKTIHPSECYAGQLRGISVCVQMTDDDGDFHLGTTSGDVLKVNTSSKVLTACGPQKKKLSMGVTALLLPKTGGLIVGTGEGTVALCTGSDCQVKKRMRVEGAVTSLTCRGRDDQFFLGTNKGQMHRSAYATFKEELVAVCHTEAVNDIVFPDGSSLQMENGILIQMNIFGVFLLLRFSAQHKGSDVTEVQGVQGAGSAPPCLPPASNPHLLI
ncbi:cilia- and flagella-associated protein 52-like [Columba livia]|uniref:cilia- and flagella-associated protein 52-like n=1 Tax=Columba livia TaxID=8932 RepID=UPI0031BABA5F